MQASREIQTPPNKVEVLGLSLIYWYPYVLNMHIGLIRAQDQPWILKIFSHLTLLCILMNQKTTQVFNAVQSLLPLGNQTKVPLLGRCWNKLVFYYLIWHFTEQVRTTLSPVPMYVTYPESSKGPLAKLTSNFWYHFSECFFLIFIRIGSSICFIVFISMRGIGEV